MKVKLLKDIVSTIAGNIAVGVVDLLYEKKNVNEFLIAKKLKLTINQTRNILYKLGDQGLVSFIRKKDRKKGGWYTYFWTLNLGKSLEKFKSILNKDIDNLNIQLNTLRKSRFYRCPNNDPDLNEESALLHEYHCPECGDLLELKDNAPNIASLQKEIAKRGDIITEINEDLGAISIIEGKTRERKSRAEAKKKTKERLVRKKERERLAKKEERKKGKAKMKKLKVKIKKKGKKEKKKDKKYKKKIKKSKKKRKNKR